MNRYTDIEITWRVISGEWEGGEWGEWGNVQEIRSIHGR